MRNSALLLPKEQRDSDFVKVSMMADETPNETQWTYEQFIKQRKELADSAEGASKTFDKAILTFGSAVFGASIAFLKDVAPKPPNSLSWLCVSWSFFTAGLLAVVLSFQLSHRTCMSRIEDLDRQYQNPEAKESKDVWGVFTTVCNFACILFLFFGIVAWIVFATHNLANPGGK